MSNIANQLKQLYAKRELPSWGEIHDAALTIERLHEALANLLEAYEHDVNPNDRSESAIQHARAAQTSQVGEKPSR